MEVDKAREFVRAAFSRSLDGGDAPVLHDADLDVACMAVCQNVVGVEACAAEARSAWQRDADLRHAFCDGEGGFGARNAAMSRITRMACGVPSVSSASTQSAVPATDVEPLRHNAATYSVPQRSVVTVVAYSLMAMVPFLIVFIVFIMHASGPIGTRAAAATPKISTEP